MSKGKYSWKQKEIVGSSPIGLMSMVKFSWWNSAKHRWQKSTMKRCMSKVSTNRQFPKRYLFLEHFHLLSTVVKLHDYMQSPTDRAKKNFFLTWITMEMMILSLNYWPIHFAKKFIVVLHSMNTGAFQDLRSQIIIFTVYHWVFRTDVCTSNSIEESSTVLFGKNTIHIILMWFIIVLLQCICSILLQYFSMKIRKTCKDFFD